MSTTQQNTLNYEALVMVVDDNPEFLEGIEVTLEMEGFKVWKAANGQHALDELQAVFSTPTPNSTALERLPDVILVDIMMPVMDGYTLYEKLRANPYTNHIPIIFLTAKDSDDDIQFGKEMGSDDYLTKLCSSEELLASIRGKVKRIQQRHSISVQYANDEIDKPLAGGNVILIGAILALIIFAFCMGAVVAITLLG